MMGEKKDGHGEAAFMASDRQMRYVKRKVDRYQLQELPVETLVRMDAELADRQAELVACASELEEKIDRGLKDGRGLIIAELRSKVRRYVKEHREIGQERSKIHDARQQRILEDRMIRVLGSKKRVQMLEWFIITLILGVVGMLIYDLAHPDLPTRTRVIIGAIDVAACLVFLAEFFFRHHHAESKRWFWRRHWIDFFTSIPLPHIPQAQLARFGRLARVARLTRVMRLARLLRVLRVVFFFWRGMDKLQDVLDVRLMKKSLLITVVILILGAALIWVSEAGMANTDGVESFGESIWWSFTTVVTGGFGDIHNPQTLAGRIVTVVLIIVGMIVVGIFIATLTSVLVGDESELLISNQKALARDVERLTVIVEQLAEREGVELPPQEDELE